MKPTWEHWSEVFVAQEANVDIDPNEPCFYNVQWNRHDDIDWLNYLDLHWNSCTNSLDESVDMTLKLTYGNTGALLWHDQNEESTYWKPVTYPN